MLTVSRTENSPILGIATDDELDHLSAFAVAHAKRMTSDLVQGDPKRAGQLVEYYAELCRPLGIDAVLAVCQSWHETSLWSSVWFQAPRRNPAGIGVNGQHQKMPGPAGLWQPMPAGYWAKGRAYGSYAGAAMAQVHGLGMWAGANPAALADLAARARKTANTSAYTPPSIARGSATSVLHLGSAYNPRHIGWAHPGHDPKMTPAAALAAGRTYGHGIARLARTALA